MCLLVHATTYWNVAVGDVLEMGKVDNRDRMIRRRFQEQDTP